uniref:GAR domain-containing protein n=1 Tax=Schistocephalus solidus TaxID=70667 RepID=A0A183SQS8_SCHSO
LELELVANVVDAKGDGFIDMQKFNAALRNGAPAGAAKVDLTKAERSAIEHETSHQVSLCTCHNTYLGQVEVLSKNFEVLHHFILSPLSSRQFGDSQKLRLVRFLHSNVMVRVGGGWVPLTEYLAKNDPCRGRFPTFSCHVQMLPQNDPVKLTSVASLMTSFRELHPFGSCSGIDRNVWCKRLSTVL